MAARFLWSLCLVLALLLPPGVSSQDFDLSDALDDGSDPATPSPKPAKPAAPAAGGGGGDFKLEDLQDLDGATTTTTTTTTTKAPPKVVPKAPVKPKPKPGGFSDDDLFDVGKDDSYKPDKGKGGRPSGDKDQVNQYDDNGETTAEVGTIAGIVSAVTVALIAAITSYVSYQKKKLCFGLQQSLNTDMVKAENPESVVATEPQVQQTLLEPPNTEPPTEENAV
ncbi:CD99 antigen-like protein 2 isoform X2 [Pseudoliparis swirei]|uniref:CD99 antigen-like protein 2 isoform X2 n=1 Tax=Pseudoliparis swirei TaxID=2059687 RepID=UPI0024BE4BCB|nr:CD99 antigen-like protein 2 isoform X2 [Pseudoliparis swirei]